MKKMLGKRRRNKELKTAIAHSQRLLAEGKHKENLDFLEGGVAERFPDDAEIRLLFGTALLESKPEVGFSEIAKAIDLDPNDPVRLVRAARIMYDMKQFDSARSYMTRAKAAAPEDFVFEAELLNLESNFAALAGQDDLAEQGLRLAVKKEPKMETLALDLAEFLAKRGRDTEALEVIDEAVNLTKDKGYLERLRTDILDEDGLDSPT
jgi:tetratricopeptide (TPR) repeat protein